MRPDEFDLLVHSAITPVVVDFWAPWCVPCKITRPLLEKLAEEFKDRVSFVAINADDSPELASRYMVLGIPTVIALRDGKEEARLAGAQGQRPYRALFEALANSEAMPAGTPPIERMVRLGAGSVLAAAGLQSGYPLLLAVGLIVAFSGIYDRCPLWKAVRGVLFNRRSRRPEEIDQGL